MDARVAHLDQLAYLRESVVDGGPAHGARAIDVSPYRGIHARVLPDRALDIGTASWAGIPLSWTSRVGECGPSALTGDEAWLDGFGGGLLTTCGLRNVGFASEGHGFHGNVSYQRATEVSATRRELDAGEVLVEIAGRVAEASALDHRLVLARRIRVRSGHPRLEVDDVTVNEGAIAEPAPLLYHLNFGFPLVAPGTRVEIAAERTIPQGRSPNAVGDRLNRIGPPDRDAPPLVVEHVVAPDADGCSRARLTNEELGVVVEVGWRAAELPRVHQWVHSAPHTYVVAIEPANCSLKGRAADREAGCLPVLEPGERRATSWWLEARPVAGIA